jgi:nucleoside-diphosphate-sugar epimerase
MDLNDGRVITNFIGQVLRHEPLTIFGDGCQTRSFQYIDDLIAGIIRFMNTEYSLPINLGNPQEFTILDLANTMKEVLKDDIAITFQDLPTDDPQQRKPDISNAKQILNWQPKIMLREGIERTFNYFAELSDLCYR